jgi:predicted HTH domain antitoxin
MQTMMLELPDDIFSALRRSPEEAAKEMRLLAAMYWYERGDVSQEKAAQIAGLDRSDFLTELGNHKIDVFAADLEELKKEMIRD